MMQNRIWIELDKPEGVEQAVQACRKANILLKRLGVDNGMFDYEIEANLYTFGGPMGSERLLENGTWFNLDFLAGINHADGVPNLDAMSTSELISFRTAANNLISYADYQIQAIERRTAGAEKTAKSLEMICQRIYNGLPAWARW